MDGFKLEYYGSSDECDDEQSYNAVSIVEKESSDSTSLPLSLPESGKSSKIQIQRSKRVDSATVDKLMNTSNNPRNPESSKDCLATGKSLERIGEIFMDYEEGITSLHCDQVYGTSSPVHLEVELSPYETLSHNLDDVSLEIDKSHLADKDFSQPVIKNTSPSSYGVGVPKQNCDSTATICGILGLDPVYDEEALLAEYHKFRKKNNEASRQWRQRAKEKLNDALMENKRLKTYNHNLSRLVRQLYAEIHQSLIVHNPSGQARDETHEHPVANGLVSPQNKFRSRSAPPRSQNKLRAIEDENKVLVSENEKLIRQIEELMKNPKPQSKICRF